MLARMACVDPRVWIATKTPQCGSGRLRIDFGGAGKTTGARPSRVVRPGRPVLVGPPGRGKEGGLPRN